MTSEFASIRKRAPEIHAVYKGAVTVLKPCRTDVNYDSPPRGPGYLKGTGSKDDPYAYLSAAVVSPHYVIVDLWFNFRPHASSRPVFIRANDWVFEAKPDGVVAEDGHFTRLS